jgi:hypothetical protein
MDLTSFKASLTGTEPPKALGRPLRALWLVAKGGWTVNDNWTAAHELAQKEENETGSWVHAHLHRVEGDLNNAGYWYGKAKRTPSKKSLQAEWDEIAAALL